MALAAGVPGTVSGLEYARKKYGTMTLKALIEPAIKLAEDGFTLVEVLVALGVIFTTLLVLAFSMFLCLLLAVLCSGP